MAFLSTDYQFLNFMNGGRFELCHSMTFNLASSPTTCSQLSSPLSSRKEKEVTQNEQYASRQPECVAESNSYVLGKEDAYEVPSPLSYSSSAVMHASGSSDSYRNFSYIYRGTPQALPEPLPTSAEICNSMDVIYANRCLVQHRYRAASSSSLSPSAHVQVNPKLRSFKPISDFRYPLPVLTDNGHPLSLPSSVLSMDTEACLLYKLGGEDDTQSELGDARNVTQFFRRSYSDVEHDSGDASRVLLASSYVDLTEKPEQCHCVTNSTVQDASYTKRILLAFHQWKYDVGSTLCGYLHNVKSWTGLGGVEFTTQQFSPDEFRVYLLGHAFALPAVPATTDDQLWNCLVTAPSTPRISTSVSPLLAPDDTSSPKLPFPYSPEQYRQRRASSAEPVPSCSTVKSPCRLTYSRTGSVNCLGGIDKLPTSRRAVETRLVRDALDSAISSLTFMSYRRDFPPMYRLGHLSSFESVQTPCSHASSTDQDPAPRANECIRITSDAGWGCTIRCAQMLLFEVLRRHFLWASCKKTDVPFPESSLLNSSSTYSTPLLFSENKNTGKRGREVTVFEGLRSHVLDTMEAEEHVKKFASDGKNNKRLTRTRVVLLERRQVSTDNSEGYSVPLHSLWTVCPVMPLSDSNDAGDTHGVPVTVSTTMPTLARIPTHVERPHWDINTVYRNTQVFKDSPFQLSIPSKLAVPCRNEDASDCKHAPSVPRSTSAPRVNSPSLPIRHNICRSLPYDHPPCKVPVSKEDLLELFLDLPSPPTRHPFSVYSFVRSAGGGLGWALPLYGRLPVETRLVASLCPTSISLSQRRKFRDVFRSSTKLYPLRRTASAESLWNDPPAVLLKRVPIADTFRRTTDKNMSNGVSIGERCFTDCCHHSQKKQTLQTSTVSVPTDWIGRGDNNPCQHSSLFRRRQARSCVRRCSYSPCRRRQSNTYQHNVPVIPTENENFNDKGSNTFFDKHSESPLSAIVGAKRSRSGSLSELIQFYGTEDTVDETSGSSKRSIGSEHRKQLMFLGKRPGDWFGLATASYSIKYLVETCHLTKDSLAVYVNTDGVLDTTEALHMMRSCQTSVNDRDASMDAITHCPLETLDNFLFQPRISDINKVPSTVSNTMYSPAGLEDWHLLQEPLADRRVHCTSCGEIDTRYSRCSKYYTLKAPESPISASTVGAKPDLEGEQNNHTIHSHHDLPKAENHCDCCSVNTSNDGCTSSSLKENEKGILICFPLTLGNSRFLNQLYHPSVTKYFEFPWFVGAIGSKAGKKQAFYFVGKHERLANAAGGTNKEHFQRNVRLNGINLSAAPEVLIGKQRSMDMERIHQTLKEKTNSGYSASGNNPYSYEDTTTESVHVTTAPTCPGERPPNKTEGFSSTRPSLLQRQNSRASSRVPKGSSSENSNTVSLLETELLYLDPHVVQDSATNVELDWASFHNPKIFRAPTSLLDPGILIAFYCPNRAAIHALSRCLASVAEGDKHAPLTITNKRYRFYSSPCCSSSSIHQSCMKYHRCWSDNIVIPSNVFQCADSPPGETDNCECHSFYGPSVARQYVPHSELTSFTSSSFTEKHQQREALRSPNLGRARWFSRESAEHVHYGSFGNVKESQLRPRAQKFPPLILPKSRFLRVYIRLKRCKKPHCNDGEDDQGYYFRLKRRVCYYQQRPTTIKVHTSSMCGSKKGPHHVVSHFCEKKCCTRARYVALCEVRRRKSALFKVCHQPFLPNYSDKCSSQQRCMNRRRLPPPACRSLTCRRRVKRFGPRRERHNSDGFVEISDNEESPRSGFLFLPLPSRSMGTPRRCVLPRRIHKRRTGMSHHYHTGRKQQCCAARHSGSSRTAKRSMTPRAAEALDTDTVDSVRASPSVNLISSGASRLNPSSSPVMSPTGFRTASDTTFSERSFRLVPSPVVTQEPMSRRCLPRVCQYKDTNLLQSRYSAVETSLRKRTCFLLCREKMKKSFSDPTL